MVESLFRAVHLTANHLYMKKYPLKPTSLDLVLEAVHSEAKSISVVTRLREFSINETKSLLFLSEGIEYPSPSYYSQSCSRPTQFIVRN